MSSLARFRDVREHDGSPAAHIHRSDAIGMTSAATLGTLKDRLRRPVRLGDMPTLGTLSGCIARVNEKNGYAHPLRFVLDEKAQLRERPARELSTLLPSSPHPQAYPRQIFEGDSSLRAFGKLNKLFADYVVGVASETLLFARELLQATFRGVRALLLKLRPEPPVAMPDGVDGLPTSDVAVGVCRYVLDPEVNPDNTFGYEWLWVFDLTDGEQVELTPTVYQICLPDTGFKQLHLSLPSRKRDVLPRLAWVGGPDGDGRLVEIPRENTVVVGNRAVGLEPSLRAFVESVGISNLRKTPDDHLSGKSKLRLHVPIAKLLKRVLPKRLLLPRHPRDAIASSVGERKRLFEDTRLLRCRAKFELRHEFHILKAYCDNGGFSIDFLLYGFDSSLLLKPVASSEQFR